MQSEDYVASYNFIVLSYWSHCGRGFLKISITAVIPRFKFKSEYSVYKLMPIFSIYIPLLSFIMFSHITL